MKNAISICIGLASLTLALGYVSGTGWIGAGAVVALGLFWLVGHQRQWSLAGPGLIVFAGAAAFGVWQGVPAGWMLFGAVAALAAWDLDHFTRRLRQAAHIKDETQLRRNHLQRLVAVAGLGVVLAGLALSFQIKLNLGWAMLLGLLIIIGLSRAVAAINGKSD
jgi:hypothetical protein